VCVLVLQLEFSLVASKGASEMLFSCKFSWNRKKISAACRIVIKIFLVAGGVVTKNFTVIDNISYRRFVNTHVSMD
jgi:hypothetical protein